MLAIFTRTIEIDMKEMEKFIMNVVKKVNKSKILNERDCPNCYGNKKLGTMYIRDGVNWVCEDCGYSFTENELSKDMVFWWCDSCGVYLNTQNGFTRNNYTWTCTNCGFENDVTDANIEKSKVEQLIEKLIVSKKIDAFLLNAEKYLREIYPENQYFMIPIIMQMIKSYLSKEYSKIPWRTLIALGIYTLDSKIKNKFTMSIKNAARNLQWITTDVNDYIKWRDSSGKN